MVPSEISSYWLYITPTPLLKERSSVIKSNLVSLFTVVHRSPESKPTGAVSLDVFGSSLVSVHGAHCKLSLERKFVGQQYLKTVTKFERLVTVEEIASCMNPYYVTSDGVLICSPCHNTAEYYCVL